MSNLRPLSGQANLRVPTPPRGETIARYETYLEAQRAVDYLSDQQFPVQFVTIVGIGLRMVERVTGRLSYPRVAGASALSGLYFGFFVGLALSLFGGGNDLSIFAVALVGAGFGMLFGIISYALTGGRRDFTSTSQIVASEYEVLCLSEQAGTARDILRRLPGSHGRGQVRSEQGQGGPGRDAGGQSGGPGHPGRPYPYGGQQPGQSPGGQYPPVQYPPPTGMPSPYGSPPGPQQQGASQPPAEPAPTEVIGPTYGEMIERQRQEQRAREAAEREAERLAAERLAAERLAAERLAAEREAAEREAARLVAEREAGQAANDRAANDRAASDRAASDRAASDRAASDRAASDRAASDRAASDRAANDRAHREPGSGTRRPKEPGD
jgi:hypothetical protein